MGDLDLAAALVAPAAVVAALTISRDRWARWQQQLAAETAIQHPGCEDLDALSPAGAPANEFALAGVGGRPAARSVRTSVGSGPASDVLELEQASSPPAALVSAVRDGRAVRWGFAAAAAGLALGTVFVVGERPALAAFVYLSAVLVPLLVCDVRLHRLPTCFIKPAYPVTAVAFVADAAVTGHWAALGTAAAGSALLGGFYLAMRLAPGRMVGLGDVRLAVVLGALLGWFGWGSLAAGALGTFVLSFLVSVPMLALRRTTLQARVAFGPFMLIAAALTTASNV